MFNPATEDSASVTEEYEEELTAAEVLQKLEDAWINEKQAPELLGNYRNTQIQCSDHYVQILKWR